MARVMAAWVSCATSLILRSEENVREMLQLPREEVLWIDVMPWMSDSSLSSGVVTVLTMVSGPAPGYKADTEMLGNSMLGRSLTGSLKYEERPKPAAATASRVVATGRRMKISEKFTAWPRLPWKPGRASRPAGPAVR